MLTVKLPLWKSYLYSLMERIRIFYAINVQEYNFGFNQKQKLLLKSMFYKYTQKGGGYTEIRSIRYSKLIDAVRNHMVIAKPEEMEIVSKLQIVKLINVEDLMKFEIKQLKELAKEVGINALAAAKMKPEDLAKEIIKAVDPKKGYSTEFVKWYEAIPDSFLNSIEADGGSEGGGSNEELIEAIQACTKMSELKEIVEDKEIGAAFAGFDISKFKLAGPTKKAMVEFLQNPPAAEESGSEGGDDDKAEIAKAIKEAKSEDDLVAVIEAANELFADFDPGEVSDLDEMKKAILKHLGIEEEEAPKKLSLKDRMKQKKESAESAPPAADKMVIDFDPTPGNFDPEKVYEQADGFKIGELKKFYSQIAKITRIEMPSNKPGVSKDILMDALGNALMDLAENGPKEGAAVCECPPAEGESEITRKLVEDAAKADDKEALAAMCEKLGIALNPLEKRNVSRMKDKLIAKLPEDAPTAGKLKGKLGLKKGKEEEAPAPAADESKLVAIFATVEKMVLEEAEEKAIIEAVTPIYKEMGKSALAIRSRVKTLIEVVQVEHDLKKK